MDAVNVFYCVYPEAVPPVFIQGRFSGLAIFNTPDDLLPRRKGRVHEDVCPGERPRKRSVQVDKVDVPSATARHRIPMGEEVLVPVTIDIPDPISQKLHVLVIGDYPFKMAVSLPIHGYTRVCAIFDRHDQVEISVRKKMPIVQIGMADLGAVLRKGILHLAMKRGMPVQGGVTKRPGDDLEAVKAIRIRRLGECTMGQDCEEQQDRQPFHFGDLGQQRGGCGTIARKVIFSFSFRRRIKWLNALYCDLNQRELWISSMPLSKRRNLSRI